MSASASRESAERPWVWNAGPAIAGWCVPGLGHWLIGERKRGLIIMIALYGLFVAGLLIGGIDVIDSREDRLWFFGQVVMGPPAVILNSARAGLAAELYDQIPRGMRSNAFGRAPAGLGDVLASSDQEPAYRKSIGRVNELGTLYCTLAGLLNLLAIMDVAYRQAPAPIKPPPTRQPKVGKVVTREDAS